MKLFWLLQMSQYMGSGYEFWLDFNRTNLHNSVGREKAHTSSHMSTKNADMQGLVIENGGYCVRCPGGGGGAT